MENPNFCISLPSNLQAMNFEITELSDFSGEMAHIYSVTLQGEKATGVLGQMVSEVNPVQLAKTRNRMLVAAKIADAMKARLLNQKQFAKLMGKTESEISDWLSGDRNFTIDTLFDIGQALGISFLSETIQYTTADAYEFEPMMVSEPFPEK